MPTKMSDDKLTFIKNWSNMSEKEKKVAMLMADPELLDALREELNKHISQIAPKDHLKRRRDEDNERARIRQLNRKASGVVASPLFDLTDLIPGKAIAKLGIGAGGSVFAKLAREFVEAGSEVTQKKAEKELTEVIVEQLTQNHLRHKLPPPTGEQVKQLFNRQVDKARALVKGVPIKKSAPKKAPRKNAGRTTAAGTRLTKEEIASDNKLMEAARLRAEELASRAPLKPRPEPPMTPAGEARFKELRDKLAAAVKDSLALDAKKAAAKATKKEAEDAAAATAREAAASAAKEAAYKAGAPARDAAPAWLEKLDILKMLGSAGRGGFRKRLRRATSHLERKEVLEEIFDDISMQVERAAKTAGVDIEDVIKTIADKTDEVVNYLAQGSRSLIMRDHGAKLREEAAKKVLKKQ